MARTNFSLNNRGGRWRRGGRARAEGPCAKEAATCNSLRLKFAKNVARVRITRRSAVGSFKRGSGVNRGQGEGRDHWGATLAENGSL